MDVLYVVDALPFGLQSPSELFFFLRLTVILLLFFLRVPHPAARGFGPVCQAAVENPATPDHRRVALGCRFSSFGAPLVKLSVDPPCEHFLLCLGIIKPDFLASLWSAFGS